MKGVRNESRATKKRVISRMRSRQPSEHIATNGEKGDKQDKREDVARTNKLGYIVQYRGEGRVYASTKKKSEGGACRWSEEEYMR